MKKEGDNKSLEERNGRQLEKSGKRKKRIRKKERKISEGRKGEREEGGTKG